MAERIYLRSQSGDLEPLEEEPFATEDELQRLLAEHPELLEGEQMRPGDPRRWIVINREQGVPEKADEGARWYLDHLLVDQDAIPTLVEVKRSSNSEIRRTIVGQMLDYAAHATQTWTVEDLRQSFERSANSRGVDPHGALGKLLQSEGETDVEEFWERVATNLTAGRLRLLFVADSIPDPLQRVVEFLNEQMPGIEVMAVEIKQFRSEASQTLVPRVIGRIADSGGRSGPRRKLDQETFLEEFSDESARSVAKRLLCTATKSGAVLAWGSSGLSIRVRCSVMQQPISVCWMFPPSVVGWMGLRNISFGETVSNDSWPAPDSELRVALDNWVQQFSDDGFCQDSGKDWARIWMVDYDTAAAHLKLLEDRLGQILRDLKKV